MSNPDVIKREFLDIYASLSALDEETVLHGSNEPFRGHFERLNRLAAIDVEERSAEILRTDRELQPAINHITRLKRVHGLRMEIERARAILNARDPWSVVKSFVFYPNYLMLARMEYEGANLARGDRVVFLGCGPVPLSLICLYTQHGIEGIGIEQDPEYADLSRKVIDKLDLSGHIRIMPGNHFSLPLEQECRLIMIGADALPKDNIFAHLARTIPDGARLSYRIYEKGLRRLLDTQSVFELPRHFREYSRIRPEPPVNNTSIFVVKAGGIDEHEQ